MMSLMVVFGHMCIGRVVATEGDAASLAGPEMYPVSAVFDTFLTDILFCQL